MKFNSIAIAPTHTLEAGDQIAYSFLGNIVSGKITAVAFYGYQLTAEHHSYMKENNLTIPGPYERTAGEGFVLLFGDFFEVGDRTISDRSNGCYKHMYVREDTNMAVFSTKQ